jgi:hypothetical protein
MPDTAKTLERATQSVNESLLLALAATHPDPAGLAAALMNHVRERTDAKADRELNEAIQLRVEAVLKHIRLGTGSDDKAPTTSHRSQGQR